MSNIHFSPNTNTIPDYVLNHPTDSSLEKNNIRFRIEGKYLDDFTDKGIEKFIEKNFNDNTGFFGWGGKDLELKEVKAFIQQVAANADKLQGVTFDLADPDLGLFDDDKIKVKDIQHSFNLTLDKTPGKSASEVSFVDVTDASYDFSKVAKAEKSAHSKFQKASKGHKSTVKEFEKAKKRRDKIAKKIGGSAVKRLAELDTRSTQIKSERSGLQTEINDLMLRLPGLEADLKSASPEDKSKIEKQIKRVRREVRAIQGEREDLDKEYKSIKKEINKNHGFWSFVGGGADMNDLREANKKMAQAEERMNKSAEALGEVKSDWQHAVSRREAVEAGKSLAELDAAEQTPAEKPPVTPPAGEAPKPDVKPDAGATPPPAAGDKVPPATPAAPAAPADGVAPVANPPAATPDLALEQQIQGLLQTTDLAGEIAALKTVPPEKQMEFLRINHDYILAGNENNPLGLSNEDHATLKGLQTKSIGLMKNAFSVWGKSSWDSYLEMLGSQGKNDEKEALMKLMGGAEFANTLQPSKPYQTTPPAYETPQELPPVDPPVAPPVAPVATPPVAVPPSAGTPPTPVVEPPTAPVVTPPGGDVAEQIVPGPLPSNPSVVSSPVPAPPQAVVKPPVAPEIDFAPPVQAPVHPPVAPPVAPQPPTESVQPDLRPPTQLPATDAAPKPPVAAEAAPPVKVESAPPPAQNLTIEQLIALTPEQQYDRFHELSSSDQIALFTKIPQEGKPDILFELVQRDNLKADGRAALINVMEPAEKQYASALLENTLAQPTFTDAKMRASAEKLKAELGAVQAPAQAPVTPPVAEGPPAAPVTTPAATGNADAFLKLSPEDQVTSFLAMSGPEKQAVFTALPPDFKAEQLLALTVRQDEPQTRQALIATMNANDKAVATKVLSEALPGVQHVEPLKVGITKLLQELGAPAANTAPNTATPPVTGIPNLDDIQPVGQGGPAATPPNVTGAPPKLEMKAQIEELKTLAQNKTMFGYGGVANPGKIIELAEQVWANGTQANRSEMSKTMVEQDLSKELAGILSHTSVSNAEVGAVLTDAKFPVEKFMGAIDDSKATIMLMALTSDFAAGNKAAAGAIEKTVTGYMDGYDREGPVKKMKNDAVARGTWDKLPQSVRTQVDKMFNSWWN